eukprot:6403707-Prymnesium_polylepis.1
METARATRRTMATGIPSRAGRSISCNGDRSLATKLHLDGIERTMTTIKETLGFCAVSTVCVVLCSVNIHDDALGEAAVVIGDLRLGVQPQEEAWEAARAVIAGMLPTPTAA